jgi:hypothetical protein
MRRTLVLVLTLAMTATCGFAADTTTREATEEDAQEAVALLIKQHPSDAQKATLEAIRKRAAETPEFRSQLVAELTRRLDGYKEPYKGDGEIRVLGELQAGEAAPVLLRRWKSIPKKVWYLDSGDPRIQLVWALGAILSGQERRTFLTSAMDDEDEAPEVRMQATVTLCKTEDPEGIRRVLKLYEQDRKRFGSRIPYPPSNNAENPTTQPWDQDADGLADYIEKGLLLDPTNPDTDGDGVPDGRDRNPLTAPKGELSENQHIASYLFYLYATYLTRGTRDGLATPPGVCIVSTTNKWWNSSDAPSLLAGVELTGVNNIILGLSPEQSKQYDQLHGPNDTPKIMIVCISDVGPENKSPDSRVRQMLKKDAGVLEGEKLFDLSEGQANGGVQGGKMYGNARSWLIRVRKIGNVWLPVGWRLHMIT